MLKTVKKESNGEQLRPHAQNKEYLFKKQQKKKKTKENQQMGETTRDPTADSSLRIWLEDREKSR